MLVDYEGIKIPEQLLEMATVCRDIGIANCKANTKVSHSPIKDMVYVVKSCGALCSLDIGCHVNGRNINIDDFGDCQDEDPFNAPDHGCANRQFTPHRKPSKEVLDKYDIDRMQYEVIQDELECLSFGNCSLCM